ncbi:MAG: hypothetical protein DLM55_03305 [Acidimicrobiales bacterium]|nr:MAG: hypothetical protein DLM55_03305 [Acidimicrobiales bacterium]
MNASNLYGLRISATARRALPERLPAVVAFAAWELIDGPLRDNPQRMGHPLNAPFQGCWSARRGTYRIRYEIDEEKLTVSVLDIVERGDIYYSGRA